MIQIWWWHQIDLLGSGRWTAAASARLHRAKQAHQIQPRVPAIEPNETAEDVKHTYDSKTLMNIKTFRVLSWYTKPATCPVRTWSWLHEIWFIEFVSGKNINTPPKWWASQIWWRPFFGCVPGRLGKPQCLTWADAEEWKCHCPRCTLKIVAMDASSLLRSNQTAHLVKWNVFLELKHKKPQTEKSTKIVIFPFQE